MSGAAPNKSGLCLETNPSPITTEKQVWICDICHKQIYIYIYKYIAGYKTDHWAVLAFTDQSIDLGTRLGPFALTFCEYRAPVLR